ncbi:MAG: MaoC family dehydratase [Candidatus Binataceae bacterium]
MNETARDATAGTEYVSAPYLLDAAAAEAYEGAIEEPARRRRSNIHNDPEAASRAGYAAPVAAGEHTLAVLANFMVDCFGMGFLRGGRLAAAFIKPVLYGERLTAHVRAGRIAETSRELEVWVEDSRGDRVLIGTAQVARHPE